MSSCSTQSNNLFQTGHCTRVMAVINVSPESFYGGSVASGGEAIAQAARSAEAAGASMLDIGAMSTAPYKETVISPEEEKSRLVDAIEAARAVSLLPISADTQRASVAAAALDAGATIINDVSGLRADKEMASLLADDAAGVILMANESDSIPTDDVNAAQVIDGLLNESLRYAIDHGIYPENIMLDPGFGFFRNRSVPWHHYDLEILKSLGLFKKFHRPLLLGVSRKSFFKFALGREDPAQRLAGSLAVAAWAVERGVEWLRVHDVEETMDVIRMVNLMKGIERIEAEPTQ